jgi:hypothetical protein
MVIEALKMPGQVAAGVAAGAVVGKHLGETANALGDALLQPRAQRLLIL